MHSMQSLFERALEEEMGIVIEVSNSPRFALDLHECRKALNREDFNTLMVCECSQPDMVMIIKKSVELD